MYRKPVCRFGGADLPKEAEPKSFPHGIGNLQKEGFLLKYYYPIPEYPGYRTFEKEKFWRYL
jgi:hypothetical protein